MDIDAYIAANVGSWRRLEQLSARGRLSVSETDELINLYHRTGTQLSLLRSKAPDPLLLAWLSRVVLGARGRITGGPGDGWRAVRRFFTESFPLAVYQARRWCVAVGLLFTGFAVALASVIAGNENLQRRLLPPEAVQQLVNHDFADYYHQYPAQHFALQVWTNNAWVTGQCLAFGILVVPVLLALGSNCLNLAADGGLMVSTGHGGEFFGLILPHGLLELSVVFIGGGMGLRVGWAWIAPPPALSRGRSLAEAARAAMLVALGLVPVLGVSGLIEAFVTPSSLPTFVRVAIGVVAWLGLLVYVTVFGRRAVARGATSDLDEFERGAVVVAT